MSDNFSSLLPGSPGPGRSRPGQCGELLYKVHPSPPLSQKSLKFTQRSPQQLLKRNEGSLPLYPHHDDGRHLRHACRRGRGPGIYNNNIPRRRERRTTTLNSSLSRSLLMSRQPMPRPEMQLELHQTSGRRPSTRTRESWGYRGYGMFYL